MKIINEMLKDTTNLVFIDFEGTEKEGEIIAIGLVKFTLDNKKMFKKQYAGKRYYIKTSRVLGQFEERFAGITNKLLDEKGIDFSLAIEKIQNYVGKLYSTKFVTYGNYDMRMLHNTLVANNIESSELTDYIFKNNIDFANFLGRYVKSDKNTMLSLTNALKVFNVTPVGKAHDPLNDALNLALLYEAFLKNKKILRERYANIIFNQKNVPNPLRKLLKNLESGITCSKEDLLQFIDEEF